MENNINTAASVNTDYRTATFYADKSAQKENSDFEAGIKKLGKEFETFFIKYLVNSMYNSVEILNDNAGFERGIWQDFLNSELASVISEKYDLGIADAIYRQVAAQYVFEEELHTAEPDGNPGESTSVQEETGVP